MENIRANQAFWVLAVALTLGLLAVLALKSIQPMTKLLAAGGVLVSAVLGVVAKLRPSTLGAVSNIVSGIGPGAFLSLELVALLLLLAVLVGRARPAPALQG